MEIVGKLSENSELQTEGKNEMRAGKVQDKIGHLANELGRVVSTGVDAIWRIEF